MPNGGCAVGGNRGNAGLAGLALAFAALVAARRRRA
jgi:MYXO-CTERM domain-containing protein